MLMVVGSWVVGRNRGAWATYGSRLKTGPAVPEIALHHFMHSHSMQSPQTLLRRCSSGSYFLTITLLGLVLIVTVYYNAGGIQINQIYNTYTKLEWSPLVGEHGFDIKSALDGKLTHIDQDDVRLVGFVVQSGMILPPPPNDKGYNLKEPNILDPSMGQSEVVLRVLNNMTGGFFIECGALDGETRSNTLYMEKELGWSGLLIEADPSNFKLVQKKGRKAHTVNVCLATKRYPHAVMFRQQFNTGKISDVEPDPESKSVRRIADKLVRVQCLPLYTLLLALNVTTVDYFSLDVEGAEFEVLRTIPFDRLLIRVLSVEYIHNSVPGEEIADYMAGFGYRVEAQVNHESNWANDYIFVHESVYLSADFTPATTTAAMGAD